LNKFTYLKYRKGQESQMSRAQMNAWYETLNDFLSELRERPQNLDCVKKIDEELSKTIENKFSKYSTATLVIWALRLFRFGYLSRSSRENHRLGFISAEVLVNALKFGKAEPLGPHKTGKYEMSLKEASEDHSDLLYLTFLKFMVKGIYDKAKVVNPADHSYKQKMQGVTESLRDITNRWEEVDPLSVEVKDDYAIRPIFFLNRPKDYEKEASMAQELVDPIWYKLYGFRYSALIRVLTNLKDCCDERSKESGCDMYTGRIEGNIIKNLCQSLSESEVQQVIGFVSWTKERIMALENMGQDPVKLLMTCALVKYSAEDRYLTNNHLLFWALGTFLETPRFDEKLERAAKDLSLSNKLNLWRKNKEAEVLNDFKDFFEHVGFANMVIQKELIDCGEIDLLGTYKKNGKEYGVICELKELTPRGMTTYDYVRRAYFVEENPAFQLEKKIGILKRSKKAQTIFLNLVNLAELPSVFIPIIILNGQPLSYSGRIPLITIYDDPAAVQGKIERYLAH